MKNTVTLLLALISMTSCNKQSNNAHVEVIIKKSIDLSELIEKDINFQNLEHKNTSLIESISKITYQGGNIYISDSRRKILCFDRQGKIVFTIDGQGKGPGEYASMQDFAVTDESIIINDSGGRDLIYYNSQGDFVREVKTNTIIQEIIPFTNDNLLIYRTSGFENTDRENKDVLWIISQDYENLVESYFPYENNLEEFYFPGMLNRFKDTYNFSHSGDNTIYYMNTDDLVMQKRYVFDFGEYNFPDDIRNTNQEQMEQIFFNGGVMMAPHRIIETQDHFVFQTLMMNNSENIESEPELNYWFCILYKETGKCYAFDEIIMNDGSQYPFPIAADPGGNLISPFESNMRVNKDELQNPQLMAVRLLKNPAF